MKMVGKPDAGNPHVRFDEGGGSYGPSLLDVRQAKLAPSNQMKGADHVK